MSDERIMNTELENTFIVLDRNEPALESSGWTCMYFAWHQTLNEASYQWDVNPVLLFILRQSTNNVDKAVLHKLVWLSHASKTMALH